MTKTIAIYLLSFTNCKTSRTTSIIYFACMTIIGLNAQNQAYTIKGNLQLDSVWNPKVYLSHISDFSKMYTMSKSMVIAESEVNSSGSFKFDTDFLPEEDNLYRIHIAKKGNSELSLVIGGENENHFFLVANNTSTININSNSKLFNDVTFLTDNKNKTIEKIDAIVRYIDSTNMNATRIKSQFVTSAFNEQLRQIADTSSNPLVSLYALHKSNFETNIAKNTEYYQDLTKKWTSENSIYFKNFKSKIPVRKTNFSHALLIISGFIISFLLGFIINRVIQKNNSKTSQILKSLSIQERKIYGLLKEGKSNKAISDELHIGISTVKSHVTNIYSKLNIKSRKDAIDFEI